MWGGGKWIVQNKVLPGFYHKFLSESKASIPISDRGVAAIGLELDWGPDGVLMEVENSDFQRDTRRIFGYGYTDERMRPLREIFLNAVTLHVFRLNGGGEKASNKWATAKYSGIRGNDIKTAIVASVDEEGAFDVETYLGGAKVDTQRAKAITDLKDNDFVVWKADAGTLTADAGTGMTGGTNGTATGESHQAFLAAAERTPFHTLACNSNDKTTIALYVAYVKRMCNEEGKVFQLVVPGADSDGAAVAPDDYNVIVIQNKVTDDGAPEYGAIYWALGAHAGCAVNKTLQNRAYDGEYTLDVNFTQTQLRRFIEGGKFVFHEAGGKVRVLADINSFVTLTEEEQAEFRNNQSVRVFYQQVNDIGAEFNKNWQGITPNDTEGRSALRGVIIDYLNELQSIRAIQEFDQETVKVEAGEAKGAVLLSYPTNAVNAMYQLYATITVQ